jgi:prevent-host-death family protein
MGSVTMSELRDRGEEIMERVESGESVTVTRSGAPVAEIRPLRRRGLDRATLLERWRHLPPVDPAKFRDEVDAVFTRTTL